LAISGCTDLSPTTSGSEHWFGTQDGGVALKNAKEIAQDEVTPLLVGGDRTPHPNMYLHLVQTLKYKVMTHNQTREALDMEISRRNELERTGTNWNMTSSMRVHN